MRVASPVRVFVLAITGLAVSGVLAGCKQGSALHSRYDNFRAYYNSYYNATQKLEQGEASVERAGVAIDRDRLVPVFPTTATVGNTGGPFQEAIDKSAELLRERPSSKWADDALLVIGKAYFYQRNFVGAEQKFTETIAAADVTDDRRLRDEARFWLGRTYAGSDRFEQGVAVLEEGLAAEDGDRRWTSRMRLALGELYAYAGRWDEAAETLRAGAADEGDADLAARALVLLGQVEEEAGRFDAAAEAYALALRQRPAYELAFAAQVNRALVLGLDAERPEEGLDVVRGMLRDDKNYERRGELTLVEARLLAAVGRADAADERFRDVLYDPELNGRAVRGRAHYFYGRFFDDVRGDLVRASAHFDTAGTAYTAPPVADRPSRAALRGLASEATAFNTLAGAARQIAEADSLLALGDLSDDAFRERIAAIETERRRVFLAEQRRLQAERTAQAFSGGGGGARGTEGGPARQTSTAAAASPGATASSRDAGFLSYQNPASIQSGYIAFEQQWGARPLQPNWRRLAAVQGGTEVGSAIGGVGAFGQNNPFAVGQGPPPLDLSVVPRTPAKREELVTELAALRYELANAFFLSLGRADTARALYRAILTETPALAVATRAQFALAEIELATGREAEAGPLYQAVIDADPTSELARASRRRLGLVEADEPAPRDSLAETTAAYDAIRQRVREGDRLGGAAAFVALGDASPDAPIAPRAYFAAAMAVADAFRSDTLALVAPLPDSLVSPVLVAAYEPLQPSARPPAARSPDARSSEARPALDERLPDERLLDERSDERASPQPDAPRPPAPAGRAVDDEDLVLRGRPAPPVDAADDERPARLDAEPRVSPEPTPEAPADPAREAPVAPTLEATVESFTLRQHLAAIASRYPQSPVAARARSLAEVVPAPAPPPPDTTAAPPVALPLEAAPSDSLGTPTPAPDIAEPAEAALAPLRGEASLELGGDGFTWLVQTLSIPTEGESTVRVLREAGFRAELAVLPGGDRFGLLIGAFDTQAAAEAARSGLPAWAQRRGRVVALAEYAGTSPSRPDEDF